MADPVQRRLAAILAADVAGYSRLMGKDEEGTLAALTAHRTELVEPCITEHRGRVVKTTGDGLLAEFASVVDAVRCAVELQEGMAKRNADTPVDRRIAFRIGVNLGDVIVQDDDVFGDGVNIAARLEGLAAPGGVCVSGDVVRQVRTKVGFDLRDLGPQTVKNIAEPVDAYALDPSHSSTIDEQRSSSPRADRPSIAVLPFKAVPSEPESTTLAQGVTEDLTTAMSHFPWLSVSARHPTIAPDGVNIGLSLAGQDLGVRYVLEGSLRRSAGRIRLNTQLIGATIGDHLWAKRYDLSGEDIFELQDEIVSLIATTLGTEIMLVEIACARSKPPGELDAWDYYLLATEHYHALTAEREVKARELLRRCIALEPDFVMAHSLMAACHAQRAMYRWTQPAGAAWAEAEKAAAHAIRLDRTHPDANGVLSLVYSTRGKAKEAIAAARRAVEANPYDASALAHLGHSLMFAGMPEEALRVLVPSLWGSPRSPWFAYIFLAAGFANLCLENFEEALRWSEKTIEQDPDRLYAPYVLMAASLGHLGRVEEASQAIQQLLRIVPTFSLSRVRKNPMFSKPVDADRLIEGLRLAGLPE